MNEFMNALYNSEGREITGYRNTVAFHGTIVNVRARAGNSLSLTVVDLDNNETMSIDSEYFFEDGIYTNLHVYF